MLYFNTFVRIDMIFFSVFNLKIERAKNKPMTIKKYMTSALGNNPSIKEVERP